MYSNNIFIKFFTYIKMSKNSLAKYYENNKERKVVKDIKVFLKKKNEKKWQYGHERYENLLEDEKQKVVEYRKNIIKWDKTPYYNYKKVLL